MHSCNKRRRICGTARHLGSQGVDATLQQVQQCELPAAGHLQVTQRTRCRLEHGRTLQHLLEEQLNMEQAEMASCLLEGSSIQVSVCS